MAFLMPAAFQKRLVRYVLSQLSFLDMGSFDLDRLEGAWGRRTTGEIKQVPFKIDKLTELLKLPAWVKIKRADVDSLKLSVPFNIWREGIEVIIDGVDIRCSIEEDRQKEKGLQRGVRSNQPRDPRQTNHDPGGSDADRGDSAPGGLPSVEEMAQSFVAHQSEDERERLRSELAHNSNLEESQSSLDEEELEGLGTQFSLPAVMADFLWGIGERLKVTVRNVRFEVEYGIAVPSSNPSAAEKSDIVSFRLTVDAIDLKGVQAIRERLPEGQPGAQMGNHQLAVTNVQGFVVAEPTLFSAFSAMSVPPSPTATHVSVSRDASSVGAHSMPGSDQSEDGSLSRSNPNISESQELAMSSSTILDADPDMFRSMYHDHTAGATVQTGTSEDRHASMIDSQYHGFGSEASISQFDDYSSPDQSFLEDDQMDSPENSYSALQESQTLPVPSSRRRGTGRPDLAESADFTARAGPSASQTSSRAPPPSQLLQCFDEHHVEDTNMDQEKTPEQSAHLAGSAMDQSIFHDFPSPLEEKADPMQESRLFHESRSRAGSGSSLGTVPAAAANAEDQETQEQQLEAITGDHDDSTINHISQSQHADSAATDTDGADLAQSMLFSDQTASIYASAFGGDAAAESAELHIPGGWGSESIIGGIDETSSSMRSRTFGHQRNDSDATIHGALSQHHSVVTAANANDAFDRAGRIENQTREEDSMHASSSATSESRTALRKRLFCVEEIQLAVPVHLFKGSNADTRPADAAATSGSKSSARANTMPGGLSLYDDTLSRLERSTMRASLTASRQDSFNNDPVDPENHVSVNITSIKLENDMCLMKLLIVAVQQLLASKGSGPDATAPVELPLEVARPAVPAWSVKIESFSWALVDSMATSLDASVQPDQHTGLKTGVYFITHMRNVTVAHKPQTVGSLFSISVAMYTFGYNDDTILRFESFVPGREKSSQWSTNISIEVLTSAGSPSHVKVKTAPLRVTVDLRRLDEAFGWFGGLSGVIGLSNSVMSTTTIIEQKRPPRPIRVRFEAPENPPRLERQLSDPDATKITVAVNGIFVDLLGQTSSVHLKTSPMKLIVRPEGTAMQVNKLEFEGPVIYDSQDKAPVQALFGPLRVQYNQTPNEQNLGTLLGLLSPSTQRQEEIDDDVLIETLLQQRRKGGVLRVTIDSVDTHVERLHELEELTALADEMKKLATVTKYLPEDDRPGVMILITVAKIGAKVDVNPRVGKLSITVDNLEVVCVAMPLLFLAGVDAIQARRDDEILVSQVVPQRVRQMRGYALETGGSTPPMLVFKFVGNELEPTIKVRLCNFCAEYHVTTLMAIMGITETASGEVVIAEMIHSVANLAETTTLPSLSPQPTELDSRSVPAKPMKLDVRLKECAFGLNPRKSFAKGLLVFTNTNLAATLPVNDSSALDAVAHLRKVSFLVVDDMRTLRGLQESPVQGLTVPPVYGGQVAALLRAGYVSTTDLSEAEISIQVSAKDKAGERTLDVEVLDKLLVLDCCADSTQTMGAIFAGLSPPMPPSSELKYRTEVVPVEDMLGSIIGEMEISEDEARRTTSQDDMSSSGSEDFGSYDFAKRLGYAVPDVDIRDTETADEKTTKSRKRVGLKFDENFFTQNSSATVWGGTALEFNSTSNEYERATQAKITQSPLRVRVKDVNVIWNLFDGYDWQHTRNVIGEAVADVEKKAAARRAHRRHSSESDGYAEEESVIGDFLFNSVYIGVGPRDDPRDLARQVNRFIADDELETASYATPTTVISNTTAARGHLQKTRRKHLRLERSKHQKITFDLKGVSADVVIFPPGSGETQTSIVLRIHELEIFDHIRTSTWKKFATYMHDFGPRDVSTPMLTIELLNVKPVPDLPASELVLRVNVLPLRLHVDQDAIDFLTRFFEFKDTGREGASAPAAPGEEPFIQRFEIFAIPVKLDFKPKRVDYGGLRSGKTTEFMNFIILDGSDMVMDHIIMYGVSGFERLGKMLNDIWMPAIKQNQLPGVLAGLAPVRGIVNVGSGVKDLVMVPWQEYRKDGRLFRAMQKGAFAFARNTTTELTRLGARVALGTQAVLQNAEGLLIGQAGGNDEPANVRNTPGADEDVPQQISPYADQPLGVMAGLRGAYRHLERDMLHARDAVIAMPGEVRDSGSATGAARAMLKGAPTVVLRPAMGVTRALGTAFMGATNALDKDERRRADDKYKRPR